jgi:predicted nucleotide-binding protein
LPKVKIHNIVFHLGTSQKIGANQDASGQTMKMTLAQTLATEATANAVEGAISMSYTVFVVLS